MTAELLAHRREEVLFLSFSAGPDDLVFIPLFSGSSPFPVSSVRALDVGVCVRDVVHRRRDTHTHTITNF